MPRYTVALILLGAAACSADAGTTRDRGRSGDTAGSGGTQVVAGNGGSGGSSGSAGSGGSVTAGNGGSGAGGSAGSGGTGPAGDGGFVFVEGGASDSGPATKGSYDITTEDIPLAAGQESTVCVDRFLPTDGPIDMVRIGADMTQGGHHIIFYKSGQTTETTTPRPCSAIIDIGGSEATLGAAGTVPLFIAQQAKTELQFPTGVAYTFPAHQMTTIELHFLNTTSQDISVRGTVHIGVATEGSITDHANLMFYGPGPAQLDIPPGQYTYSHFYPSNSTTTRHVFAVTTHSHQYSTSTTVDFGAQTGPANVYKSTDWEDPPLQTFDPPLATTGPNDGFTLTCNWNNTTQNHLFFGESAKTDEMCLVWGYFYPDTGADLRVFFGQ